MDRQPLAGIQQLDEQAGISAEALDVRDS